MSIETSTSADRRTKDGPTGSMVDWDLAARAAKRLVKPGPQVTLADAKKAVAELRVAAAAADEHVSRITRIAQPAHTDPTLVVDRPGWIDVNAESMGHLLTPLVDKLSERTSTGKVSRAVGSRVTGAEGGVVLSFIAARVLGQYDVFGPRGGQLLLVAPNIMDAEQRLGVDPSDFRLWVCLHEVTHRLQFKANPWLADYLRGRIGEFVEAVDLDPDALKERVKGLAAELGRRRSGEAGSGEGLMGLVKDPHQREILDSITAVMSLLEGHAEYVMDEVGPSVVPSVATIRRKFNQRRKGRSSLDRLFRRLLGMDAKMKQYADGRTFVSGVVERIGMDGFNSVWTGPAMLPTKAELTDPGRWVARTQSAA